MNQSGIALGLLLIASAVLSERSTGPWNLDELKRPPASQFVSTEEVLQGSAPITLSSLYYAGEPWLGKPTRVFAYYARPARPEGRLPAMVLVHGGGGQAFEEWARIWAARGYAALAMDLGGRGPGRAALEDGGPDQSDEWKFFRLKDGVRNAWPYYAVAAVIRGVSLLRSFPEVNPRRVGITGISWGGYLTSLVMSLDNRLAVAIPVYGCGFLHENSVWLPHFARMTEAERKQWIESFEPSRYLAQCHTPTLWVNGTNDFAYPLDSYQKSYRACPGTRALCVTVKMPHGHTEGWARPEIYAFADAILKIPAAKPLPSVGLPDARQGSVSVRFRAVVPVTRAQIHWTEELEKPWAERDWMTADGEILGGKEARAPLPSSRPTVCFLTLTDARGLVVSSEHLQAPPHQ